MMTEGAGGGVILAMVLVALGGQAAEVEACVVGAVAAAAHMPEEEVAAARAAAIGGLAVSPGTTAMGTTTAGMTTADATTADMMTAAAIRVGRQTSAAPGGISQTHLAGAGLRGTACLLRRGGAAAILAEVPIVVPKVAQTGSGLQRQRGPWWLEGWKV